MKLTLQRFARCPRLSAGPSRSLRIRAVGVSQWLLIAFLALSVCPTVPGNPVQTVDLSGTWDFDPDNGPPTTIEVPGGGWYKQGFTTTDEADYTRSVTIPSIGQPQVTKLKFGAVNYQADLYINNVFVASSTQSHTAATFDISDYVVPGNSYNIRVHVKGHDALMVNGRSLVPNGARSWADFLPQGIFRSAELLIYPQVYIEDAFVKTSVANTSLTYEVWLRNGSAGAANVTLSGNLTSWNGDSWTYPSLPSQPVSIPANTTIKVTVGPVNWDLGSASYWWPNVPYQAGYEARLHTLNLSLSGDASHETSVRFGFRECTQGPDGQGNTCYFLNGIRVNFRGDSLQGANYDRIDNGGKGDAYSTLPGFLPGPNGWPKAVDNYQRLNYNVVRIHQIPATPYMLDVCDELGLMIIDETGIRGAGNQQDFVAGHDNMVNHLKALFTQNRNHPSIVRQSLSNEPDHSPSDSVGFQEDLYAAAMEVDGTRPLSIDAATNTYEAMTYGNFSVFRHYGYGGSFGAYTDIAHVRPDRPYGEGEFIWPADNSLQGFAWFATSTQAMRAKGASDIRPYTLLSAWASVIPGVGTGEMQLENPPWDLTPLYPLYGEDNLPDPWSNFQIRRVQAGFSPVLVADVSYWDLNKLSNNSGQWPANIPFLGPGEAVTRQLRIYNDTFGGTALDVFWELRQDSPMGAVAASGQFNATVPLGYSVTQDINFNTPSAPDGTIYHLVLIARKGGVEVFREADQKFQVVNQAKLFGTAYGTSPAWAAGREFDKASDGDPDTYFDYVNADGGYTGIDLGAGNASRISTIVFSPRTGFEPRMVGGRFQGANSNPTNNSSYTTLYTVSETPSPNTTVVVNTPTEYRYLRYIGPDGSYGNIAEMAFYTRNEITLTGTSGNLFGASPSFAPGNEFDKAMDGNTSTYYDFINPDGAFTGIDLGAGNAKQITSITFSPRSGFANRMVGGTFRGSRDGVDYTTLYTVTTAPSATPPTTVSVNSPTRYRYLAYFGPDGSYGNIAEMAFQASATIVSPPTVPAGLSADPGDAQVTLTWSAASLADSYSVKRSLTSGSGYSTVATAWSGTSYVDTSVTNGMTYHYVVSGVNGSGESSHSAEVTAKPFAPISEAERESPHLALTESVATLTVKSSVVGHTYQVQYKDDLRDSWQNVGAAQSGTGDDIEFVFPIDPSVRMRFYRIFIGL